MLEDNPLALGGTQLIAVMARILRCMSPMRARALDYLWFGLDFFVLRRERPYILGLLTNDTCNLACCDCRVANVQRESMLWKTIESRLRDFYARGSRFLYISGGEPYLWRDGRRRLSDVIELARDTGYLRTQVYTNGTVPLTARPDLTWVSIDGLGETYRTIRGISCDRVLHNVSTYDGKCAIVFTVNTINRLEIRAFLESICERLPVTKVMFFFHTPYYGVDELLLSQEQKRAAIGEIIACKGDGLPVLNSLAALRAMASGAYERPSRLFAMADLHGEYVCCRSSGEPQVCANCGYTSCAEVLVARRVEWGAIMTILEAF